MIYEHVAGLDVAVYDSMRVCVVEADENLQHIPPDVLETQLRPELAEIRILDVFEDEARGPGRRVGDHVLQVYHERPALQRLQHLYLSADFHAFDWLEHFYDDVIIGLEHNCPKDF